MTPPPFDPIAFPDAGHNIGLRPAGFFYVELAPATAATAIVVATVIDCLSGHPHLPPLLLLLPLWLLADGALRHDSSSGRSRTARGRRWIEARTGSPLPAADIAKLRDGAPVWAGDAWYRIEGRWVHEYRPAA